MLAHDALLGRARVLVTAVHAVSLKRLLLYKGRRALVREFWAANLVAASTKRGLSTRVVFIVGDDGCRYA